MIQKKFAALIFASLLTFRTFGQPVPPPAGLTGWWPGDSNTVELVNGNDASLISNANYAPGKVAQSFSFNGTSSYAQALDNPLWNFGTNEFTIELWAKFAAISGSQALVAHDTGGGTQNKWIFWRNNGLLQIHINGTTGLANIGTASFSPVINQWYHLAVTRQDSNYVFYINGTAVSTNTDTRTIPAAVAPLTFGAAEGSFLFNGQLDEISIYNRALNNLEIADVYNAADEGKDKTGFQQTTNTIWANATNGNWNIATNWIPNRVPRSGDTVWITNSGTFTVTSSVPVTISKLNLGSEIGGAQKLQLTGGTFTVTNGTAGTNATIALEGGSFTTAGVFDNAGTLNQNSGTWKLLATATLGHYNMTNGELRGGTLTVTNFNWTSGNLNADANGDKVIIPSGGVLNQLGNATRFFSYNSPATYGRELDNFGTWNWASNSVLYALQNGCVVNNHGTVNVTSSAGNPQFAYYPGYASPVWNNFGTFNKSAGSSIFYFNGVYLNNNGSLAANAGTLSIYNTTFTNNAALNVGASGICINENGTLGTFTTNSSLTCAVGDTFQIPSGTVYFQTTNISAPSLLINGGTLFQQTANVVNTINQTAGAWRLSVTTAVNNYNLSGGELRGGTLTVTNCNWINGNMNADANGDKTIIPVGGVLNQLGNATRYFSYNVPATYGRGLDNFGTWNWASNSVLYALQSGCVVNNHGTVNVTSATGNPQFAYYPGYTSPVWNNFGTFNKSAGTGIFYFNGVYLNNNYLLSASAGTLSIYNSTFTNNSTVSVSGDQLQIYGTAGTNTASISVAPGTLFTVESGSSLGFGPTSSLSVPGFNNAQLISGSLFLNTTNIATPSIWIQGGVLYQQTNIVVNTINQSGGSFQLLVPAFLANYNQTNGELRGRDITITNWTWINGNHYNRAPGEAGAGVADKTIIPTGGVLNFIGTAERYLSYYTGTTGRGLDNYGTIQWSNPGSFRGNGGAVVNNYGVVNVSTNSQFNYGGSGGVAPRWNNFGSFNRIGGTDVFYFNNVYLDNPGIINNQTGTLSLYNSTVTNKAGGAIQMASGTVLINEQNAVTTLDADSIVTHPDNNGIRLASGSISLATTNLSSPSLWIQGGVLYQQTNIVVDTINQSGGSFQLQVPAFLANYNQTNGELRGRDITITNWTWINGSHYNRAPGEAGGGVADRTIIPTGGVLNFIGTAERYLSYYTGTTGRGLDNYGTIQWSNPGSFRGNGGAVVNNYGVVNVSTNSQFNYGGSGVAPRWNNFGSFNRIGGNNEFYFNNAYLNNTGLIDVQTGILSLYNNIATNQPTGVITVQSGAVLANDNGATTMFEAGSTLSIGSPNGFRISSGTVNLRSTSITAPSVWISGGTLIHETNNVFGAINQSGGILRPSVPLAVDTYSLTNGELRGANLAADTFNWFGGALNSDGVGSNTVTVASALNISGNTAKSMSYYTLPGRSLTNNGVATWGGVSITAQGTAAFRNNGTLTVTNDVALVYGNSGGAPSLQNFGTYLKTNGTGVASFGGTVITNSGTMTVSSGGFNLSGTFSQTSGSAHLGTNFTANGGVRVEAGSFTGRGTVAGAFYNNGIVNPGASPGLISGASYTNTATGILNIELGGLIAGTNYDQVNLSGAAMLDGTMNVTLANNFAPQLSNSFTVMRFASHVGTFSSITPPPGIILDAVYSNTNLILTVTGLTNAPLEITSYPSNQTIWTPDPVTFAVGISGVTPIAFQWQHAGTNLLDATNSAFNIPAVTTTDAGIYNVLVTDGNGGTTNASATLTVIPFVGTMNWTNSAGGNWNVASNWEPNRVPGATNTAIISIPGTYTVNVNASAAVSNLFVGQIGAAGNPTLHIVSANTLALNGDALIETNAIVALNGLLQTANRVIDMRGRIDWYTGTLSGPGHTIIASNALVYFTGSQATKTIVTNIVENYGTWTTSPDAGIGPGQLPRFSGGANLTNHVSGVINMGANGLNYAGAQTPRSYLVNFGRIVTSTTSAFSPSNIGIDFLNYGTLVNNAFTYIGRGTNYGTFEFNGCCGGISVFGDPAEYFSFEEGTQFTGSGPQSLAIPGYVRWNASAIHNGNLSVGFATAGGANNSADFRLEKNYTNIATVGVGAGNFTVPRTNLTADLKTLTGSVSSGFQVFTITNSGKIFVDNLNFSTRSFANGGVVTVRSNANFSSGSIYAGGQFIINAGATATFTSSSFDAIRIDNFGSAVGNGGTGFSGNTEFYNHIGANLYFAGGSFGGGPASVVNESAISGFGGIGVLTTNYASVLIDDPLERTLTLSSYVQKSGTTQILRGHAGGNFDIQGGVISGTNSLTGTLRNSATFNPGTPIGLLSITGNYTNASIGLQSMAIQGTGAVSNHTQVQVGGTAYLGGTLNVSFNNGFLPSPGNLFTAMVFTARSGMFDAIINPSYQLEAFYTSTTLVLRAENLLPIASLNVSGGNTQIVCQPFKVSASASDPDGTVTNISLFMNGSLIASNAGSSLTTTVEKDFPSANTFTVQATDNRSGVGSTMQNVDLTTLPLHVLTLGGFRTNDFKICMLGELGSNYMTLATTNLNNTNWVEIGPMIYTNGIWRFFDTNGNNGNQKYYKARQE